MFPDVRTIRWSAPDGLEIEGLLMTPNGAEGPLPLLTLVHGGPTWNWGAFFSDSEPNAVLLASAGYACLLPNPRGSIGRDAFAQAVIGDSGGMDFQDVMSGVDACIALGVADPERLGISGLSYGGYLAGWAVTQTDRFGAAVAMSVVSNYVSFHLTSEVWMYDEMILEGDWNDPTSQYVERSPVTHAHRCRTPTLVLQGAEDRCTPVGQGWELANAIAASAPRPSSSCIRARATSRWNGHTPSTRSGGRRPGSTAICARSSDASEPHPRSSSERVLAVETRVALLLEHRERALAGRTRLLVSAQEFHHLGAIELDGPAVEQEVGSLDDGYGLIDQLLGCGPSPPRPDPREHAQAQRAFDGVGARCGDLGDLGGLRVLAECEPRLREERAHVGPSIAPFAQLRVGLLGDVGRGLDVAGEHLDVEPHLGRAPVGHQLPGVEQEPAVAIHRLTGRVERADPSSQVCEGMTHVRLRPSVVRELAQDRLRPRDPVGDGIGPRTIAAVTLWNASAVSNEARARPA